MSKKRLRLGAYCDADNIKGEKILETIGLRDVLDFEAKAAVPLSSVMWYPTWYRHDAGSNFPSSAVELAKRRNLIPHLVWELCLPKGNPCEESIPLEDVVSGKYDWYVSSYAKSAKKCGTEIFIRFLHEFNGTWYGWSGLKNSRNANLAAKAWKHVVGIFKNEGATNVKWIWSPNAICGGTPDSGGWNHIRNYWPGGDCVDMIGIDGYNFFPFMEVEQPLLSFDACFAEIYAQCVEISPPEMRFMIAETATGEYSAPHAPLPDKASWIRNAFEALSSPAYERIDWLCWFNVKKELDWRIDSSSASLDAFKTIKDILL